MNIAHFRKNRLNYKYQIIHCVKYHSPIWGHLHTPIWNAMRIFIIHDDQFFLQKSLFPLQAHVVILQICKIPVFHLWQQLSQLFILHQTALIGELDENCPMGNLFLRSTSSCRINVFCCSEFIWDFSDVMVSSSS